MNFKKPIVAAILMGMAFSTNVVYEYQTGQSLFRSIASVEVLELPEVTAENAKELYAKIIEAQSSLEEESKLLSEKIKNVKSIKDLNLLKDKDKKEFVENLNKFLDQRSKFEEKLSSIEMIDGLSEEELAKLKIEISNHHISEINDKREELQNTEVESLKNQLCEQNKSLDSISSKLEELLKDKKEVIAATDKKEKEKEDRKVAIQNYSAMMDQLMSRLMAPQDFFQMPFPGHNSEGIDMNFLNFSQMFKPGLPGFGGTQTIYYAPQYAQTYNPNLPVLGNNFGNLQGGNHQVMPEYPTLFPQGNRPSGAFDFIQLN